MWFGSLICLLPHLFLLFYYFILFDITNLIFIEGFFFVGRFFFVDVDGVVAAVVAVWCGLGWVVVVVFYFVDTVLFCRTVFVGRWVAMVLTSSSCNLGIDNYQ